MSNKVLGLVIATALVVLSGCGAGETSAPVTFATVQPAKVTKLLVFVVENHSLDQMRAAMPYTAALGEAVRCRDELPGGDPSVAAQLSGDDGRQHVRRR